MIKAMPGQKHAFLSTEKRVLPVQSIEFAGDRKDTLRGIAAFIGVLTPAARS
jgi:hypothetical protein